MDRWVLWVELKSSIQFHRILSKVNRTPALKQFYTSSEETTKIIEFTFDGVEPEPFAKTFPKSACKSVEYAKEGTSQRIKLV